MIALLHTDGVLAPHDLAGAWSFPPAVVLVLILTAVLYGRGTAQLWRRAGSGRGIRRWQAAAFWTGYATLALALLSPLHALGDTLFSAHMVQHELLIAVAAPLLVLGRPVLASVWALPLHWRRRAGAAALARPVQHIWQLATAPLAAFLLHAAALWLWHLRGPYERAITNDAMHALQHASFLLTAILFWWSVVFGRARRAGYGVSIFYIFATALHTGGLGALLTFAAEPWYPHYNATQLWGLLPLEDQQLAGLIMWVPAGLAYAVAALLLIRAWLVESDRGAVRWQTRALARAALLLVVVAGSATACAHDADKRERAAALTGGNPDIGRERLRDYGCVSCHVIPGVRGVNGKVGPPLAGIASRSYIAGVLSNTPEHLVQWIMDPPGVDSKTAMPNVGVTQQDAQHIAAYLYTLE